MTEVLYIIIIALLGLSFGSFISVLVNRLHNGKTLFGRSECPNCHHKLASLDLVPLFSFISLKGKCRYCKEKISWQYFLVEFSTCVLFVASFVFNYFFLDFNILILIRDLVVIFSLVSIFVYDVKYMEIPDEISIPAIVVIAVLNYFIYKNPESIVLGGTIGAMFFLIQFMISKGKWIGGGDIRMGLLIGVLMGPQKAIFAIFLSYFVGAIYSIPLMVNKYFNKNKVEKVEVDQNVLPLAPFLVIGTLLVLFFSGFIVKMLS